MKKYIFILVTLLLSIDTSFGTENTHILLTKIDTAQKKLSTEQKLINKEHKKISTALHNQLEKVKKLRLQVSNIQRAKDEQLISINELENRVDLLRNQNNYQKQLINSFEAYTDYKFSDDTSFIKFKNVQSYLRKYFAPAWEETEIINNKNELDNFKSIKLGPIQLANNDNQSGIVKHRLNQAAPFLDEINHSYDLKKAIFTLYDVGSASIIIDPTLGNADKLSQQNKTLLNYVKTGGTWAYPILLFALVATIVAIYKCVYFIKLPRVNNHLVDELNVLNTSNDSELFTYKNRQSEIEKAFIDTIISTPISQKRDDLLISELTKQKYKNERLLGVITTCAAVAPLLGLLGTVSGMIHTFMMMKIFGSGDASVVSGGISQALITTELGLIVAIPALLISALLNKKSKSHNAKLEDVALKLSKLDFEKHGN